MSDKAHKELWDKRYALITKTIGMGEDEVDVLLFLADRLLKGKGKYGGLNLSGDHRSWTAELLEEHADACVYVTCRALQLERGNK